MAEKVEFKTVQSEEIKFGRNSFVEIAKKTAVSDEGENEFISISRGFYGTDGSKRFSRGKNVSLPSEEKLLKEFADKLKDMAK